VCNKSWRTVALPPNLHAHKHTRTQARLKRGQHQHALLVAHTPTGVASLSLLHPSISFFVFVFFRIFMWQCKYLRTSGIARTFMTRTHLKILCLATSYLTPVGQRGESGAFSHSRENDRLRYRGPFPKITLFCFYKRGIFLST
jgi:hypothetical protein